MPGKFEACADQDLGEQLYRQSLDGGCHRECGDVQAYGLWVGMLSDLNKWYLLYEDSQGFVSYDVFDTATAVTARFDMIERDWTAVFTDEEM